MQMVLDLSKLASERHMGVEEPKKELALMKQGELEGVVELLQLEESRLRKEHEDAQKKAEEAERSRVKDLTKERLQKSFSKVITNEPEEKDTLALISAKTLQKFSEEQILALARIMYKKSKKKARVFTGGILLFLGLAAGSFGGIIFTGSPTEFLFMATGLASILGLIGFSCRYEKRNRNVLTYYEDYKFFTKENGSDEKIKGCIRAPYI